MLFVIFVIVAPIAIWLILHFMSRQKKDEDTDDTKDLIELCAICQEEFLMSQLLEKEVGAYGRVYCFCGQCIENLYHEHQNTTNTKTGE